MRVGQEQPLQAVQELQGVPHVVLGPLRAYGAYGGPLAGLSRGLDILSLATVVHPHLLLRGQKLPCMIRTRSDYRVRAVLVKILAAATPSLNRLARAAGISVRAIRAYRYGMRVPSGKVIAALVRALRKQSRELDALADELERAAERTPTKRGKP